ncbi:MarR family winged helix-turn-helix transcriptional regulator [Novosphingobium album (ex Liu et al. 2023)]|uniref:MarR family winged helix-turn-helix transcriptional regulator n=1 Tax=Novosphingobium album (ex Liu et al. 2023) TaxID=3031130 RepID=A0ABT5WQR4_9SPHN|nr:MarR family winged helix-turn-helix transcriptional regulator [Novosphingobium album (ex Liu et al. 2023)]MDE8652374.1 MarR family winged helix-turn-helix transcriptional regulator [Novosphingobium album (ex Liu et al. 2023)]
MHIGVVGTPVEALVLRTYERRSQLFSEDLFYDPAWIILLELRNSQGAVKTGDLEKATHVPPSLVRRWLNVLLDRGYIGVRRDADDEDWYSLTAIASEKLDQVFLEPGSS